MSYHLKDTSTPSAILLDTPVDLIIADPGTENAAMAKTKPLLLRVAF